MKPCYGWFLEFILFLLAWLTLFFFFHKSSFPTLPSKALAWNQMSHFSTLVCIVTYIVRHPNVRLMLGMYSKENVNDIEKGIMSNHVQSKLVLCCSLLVEIVNFYKFILFKTFSINFFHCMYRARGVKLSVLAQFSLIVQY